MLPIQLHGALGVQPWLDLQQRLLIAGEATRFGADN